MLCGIRVKCFVICRQWKYQKALICYKEFWLKTLSISYCFNSMHITVCLCFFSACSVCVCRCWGESCCSSWSITWPAAIWVTLLWRSWWTPHAYTSCPRWTQTASSHQHGTAYTRRAGEKERETPSICYSYSFPRYFSLWGHVRCLSCVRDFA